MQNSEYYKNIIKSMRVHKRLGQNFLIDDNVAKAEAAHCSGQRVVELGSGIGILTKKVCEEAKSVVAVEIDPELCNFLDSELKFENLKLINSDFFKVDFSKFGKIDMLASNVPYNLSSKLLMWLSSKGIPAVLCLQKEFVSRMKAQPGSRDYSRLSVFASLQFEVLEIMDVPAQSFYPVPRVDSEVVYLKSKRAGVDKESFRIISLIMEHKNRKLRNAIEDASSELKIGKGEARKIGDSLIEKDIRPSKMQPMHLLSIARKLSDKLQKL